MKDIVGIWNKVLDLIKNDVVGVSYNTWIEPIIPIQMDNSVLILQVPYEFSKNVIEERYIELIKNSLLFVTGENYEIDVRIKDTKIEEEQISASTISLNQLYTFDNFVKGDSNNLAYSTAKAVSKACIEGTFCEYNPMFIFGAPGLG